MSEFLKCDAPGCDHVEDIDRITADDIGRPCPKCGADLLSQSDYDAYAAVFRPAMQAMIDAGLAEWATKADPPEQRISVHFHDGELRVSAGKKG